MRRKHFIEALTGLWCWASALLPFPFPVEPATLLEGSNLLPRREPSTEQYRNNQEGIPGAVHIAGFTPKFSQICGSSTGKNERSVPMPKITTVTFTCFSFQLKTWGKWLLLFHFFKKNHQPLVPDNLIALFPRIHIYEADSNLMLSQCFPSFSLWPLPWDSHI